MSSSKAPWGAAESARGPHDVIRLPGANDGDATKSDQGIQTAAERIEVTLAGRRYAVTYNGEALGVFRQPLCDSARVLLERGLAVETDRLVMLRCGVPAMVGSVGWCAAHMVEESEKAGPRWVRYRAFDQSLSDSLQTVDGAAQDAQVGADEEIDGQTPPAKRKGPTVNSLSDHL